MSSYSRYKSFIVDGSYTKVPFIEVPFSNSDIYVYYNVGRSRLDLISYQYYGDPNYGWLILQANPEAGSLEFRIRDNTRLRVPYPLETAIQGYEDNIKKYNKLYGLNEE
jgi:hypothetical protein